MTNRSILIIDLAKYYGGADVRVVDLAKALHGKRDYTVATLGRSPVYKRLVSLGLNAQQVPHGRGNPLMVSYLHNLIRKQGFGVVDAHNPQSQFWGHLASSTISGITRVSTVHSAYRLEHDNSPKGRFYESVLRMNRRSGAHFIAVTEAVYKYLDDAGIPQDRTTLIHNCLDMKRLHVRRCETEPFRDLGWDDDTYVLITVSRLEPVKAHKILLDGISQVVGEYSDFRCLIVGDGRLREELEAQVNSLQLGNIVHFTGFRDDIPALLAASNAFTLPSLSEGLPYALLEASSQALPMLVTAVGGMAELLEHKKTGYLIPVADADALAGGIRWLMENREQAVEIGESAHDLIRNKFSPQEMIEKTLALYDK